ncbi:MAG: hypothetical protein RIA69_19795 [Cyclobacteriaceae bacterium]
MKKIACLTILAVLSHLAYSQLNNYYTRMNHVFGNIQKSKVTTGLLKEFGVRWNEVEAYNGTISSINWVDETQWQSLYNSLYSMRVSRKPLSLIIKSK